MLDFVGRIEKEYQALVMKEIEDMKEAIARGSLVDWEQYKTMTGRISGLYRALEILDEAHKAVLER